MPELLELEAPIFSSSSKKAPSVTSFIKHKVTNPP